MAWDGKERRSNSNDHDNITRMLTAIEQHVKNFDAHIKDDKEGFDNVHKKIEKNAMYIYIGLGIVATLEVLVGAHK